MSCLLSWHTLMDKKNCRSYWAMGQFCQVFDLATQLSLVVSSAFKDTYVRVSIGETAQHNNGEKKYLSLRTFAKQTHQLIESLDCQITLQPSILSNLVSEKDLLTMVRDVSEDHIYDTIEFNEFLQMMSKQQKFGVTEDSLKDAFRYYTILL